MAYRGLRPARAARAVNDLDGVYTRQKAGKKAVIIALVAQHESIGRRTPRSKDGYAAISAAKTTGIDNSADHDLGRRTIWSGTFNGSLNPRALPQRPNPEIHGS